MKNVLKQRTRPIRTHYVSYADTCVECDKPSIQVRLVSRDDIKYWCKDHLKIAKQNMAQYLKNGATDVVYLFDPSILIGTEHYFWLLTLEEGLFLATIELMNAIAINLYESDKEIEERKISWGKVVSVKIIEIKNSLKSSLEMDVEKTRMMTNNWVTSQYINNIEESKRDALLKFQKKYPQYARTSLVASMALIGNRIKSYAGHDVEKELVLVENTLWKRMSQLQIT